MSPVSASPGRRKLRLIRDEPAADDALVMLRARRQPGLRWRGRASGGQVMVTTSKHPRLVDQIDAETVERLAARHIPYPLAVELNVDLVADPHSEDDDGNLWTLLRSARNVADVVPGSAVVIGSQVGRWLARMIAWDFEVIDDDPVIVTLELMPVRPDAVARALARNASA